MIVAAGCATASLSYCLSLGGAYEGERLHHQLWQFSALLSAQIAAVLVFALCLVLLHSLRTQAMVLMIWAALELVLLVFARIIWARLLHKWKCNGWLQQRVAVVGDNALSRAFIQQATADRHSTLHIVGLYCDEETIDEVSGTQQDRLSGDLDDLVTRSRREPLDAIVLAVPLADPKRIDRLRHDLRSVTAAVYVIPNIVTLKLSLEQLNRLGPCPAVCIYRRPLTEWQQFQKIVFDRLIGGALLVALLPTLLLIAVAIRLESPGPILFRQARIGFNNRNFTIYKFRTMYHSAEKASMTGALQARRNDPRITRVGKWLRKLSFDELPQLLNVLKGEMSLVGPRPHPPETRAADRLFQDVVEDYDMRHRVRPGITGWAQVSGWRGETITIRQIEQRVAHDLYYIDNWSLMLDIRIMILTVQKEIRSKTAF
jgi:Undecaprenyl-phosphate glucose phosphotransferase